MAALDHAWSVYRRTTDDFGYVGTVLAPAASSAMELARRLPDAPRRPIVCHAHPFIPRALAIMAEPAPADERRSRRWAA